jgi:hypothetical protein
MSDNHTTLPSGEQPPPKRKPNNIIVFIAGFFMSLAIGWAIENVTDREFLESATEAQSGWIEAVSQTSPIAVAGTYWEELEAAMTGHRGGYSGLAPFDSDMSGSQGIASPVYALVITATRFFADGGISALVQLALGALAVAVFNFRRTKGEGIFFDHLATNIILGPVAIVACASIIGLVLQGVMLGALYALSWVTGLAAAAAGATGVVGFCWYCVTKLGEKGVEHVATPKMH